MADHTLGKFTFERETKNTLVFSRTNEMGRKESQYIQKADLNGERPDSIEVIGRW